MMGGGTQGGFGTHRPRILIVDDDPNLLVLLADQLRADGYETSTARDGTEALRRLQTSWPDLLIIDMMMPRMDGLSLAREIKSRADLPIIVLSAIDAGDSKADLLEEVAEDYVTKPYHYPELRARINRVLRRLGDKVPRQSLVLGPEPHPRPPPPRGHGRRQPGRPDPDRIAAPLRAGGQPRPDRHDRNAARPRLGGDRGRRPVVRLGDDAPPAPEGRAGPEPPGPSPDGPRRRLPVGPRDGRRRLRDDRWLTPTDPTTPTPTRTPTRPHPHPDRTPTPTRPPPDPDPDLDPADPARWDQHDDDVARGLGFRSRLTLALILSAVLPLTAFGLLVLAIGAALGGTGADSNLARLLLFGLAIAVLLAIFFSYLLAADLTRPLRAIAAAVDRVSAGDLSTPIRVAGDDELARLADSHNRLAGDLERRNRELGRILAAIEGASPRDGVEFLVGKAAIDAQSAFGMIDATVVLGDPATVPTDEVVPGEARPLRAVLRVGDDALGVLVGRLPATRRWERADQDLLELFASEIAVAIRNAQLFGQVEAQNAQLLELDAAKDDFLRGVSHNLQTPLTSIRAYAEQLELDRPDQRLGIIAEQSERLSRMVRQLLTVTRLESGALHPRSEVVSLATRVRKAWEALGDRRAVQPG